MFQIMSGELVSGQKLPSVRELAVALQTNPNTIQRAFAELEAKDVVYTKKGLGRFVTEDETVITYLRKQMIQGEVSAFIQKLLGLGFTKEEIIALIEDYQGE
ncbi:GntR family transcriptional regulator [Vagococcus zengguangii]|uniref:GntR family transcriptional regulator n=2 Tax=Vagococcus zengguangii TaxID=2571750 RepID=A0A4D7CVN2_9ENTE|nr:GntR family transcriptional regulator [Vagococcus zengguangii]TLG81844.1 GntR family transcriptional regulator [Vagococcus zengguangii]